VSASSMLFGGRACSVGGVALPRCVWGMLVEEDRVG